MHILNCSTTFGSLFQCNSWWGYWIFLSHAHLKVCLLSNNDIDWWWCNLCKIWWLQGLSLIDMERRGWIEPKLFRGGEVRLLSFLCCALHRPKLGRRTNLKSHHLHSCCVSNITSYSGSCDCFLLGNLSTLEIFVPFCHVLLISGNQTWASKSWFDVTLW